MGQFEMDPSTPLSTKVSQTYTQMLFQHLPKFCSPCLLNLPPPFHQWPRNHIFPPMIFLSPVLPALESHFISEKNKTVPIHRPLGARVFLRSFPFTSQKLQQETKGTVVEQPQKGAQQQSWQIQLTEELVWASL